jgi:AhpD family alkylhydroperoxidase
MKQRINVYEKGMRAMKTLYGLSLSTTNSTVEPAIFGLIYNRVSQINGCAYCLAGDAESVKAKGETAQRIFLLNAWRETALYSDRERAALAWAEALTKLKDGVPDDVYAEASANFSDEELVDLTMSVITINAYNRVNVPFRVEAGAHEAAFAAPQEK